MKTSFSVAVLLLVAAVACAGPETIVKQRAKELNRQNNVRQGIGAPPPQYSTAVPPAGRTAAADPVARLRGDVAAIIQKTAVSDSLKQQFVRDLQAAARGSHKPSAAALGKFADSLSAALAGKTLSAAEQGRLVQNINLALNSASLSPQRADEITSDVQAIIQVAGAERSPAMKAADDLKTITAELQAAAGK